MPYSKIYNVIVARQTFVYNVRAWYASSYLSGSMLLILYSISAE